MKPCGYQFPSMSLGYASDPSPSPENFHRHLHDTYEILYVAAGRGRYIVEGNTYSMRAGTLILVSPYFAPLIL